MWNVVQVPTVEEEDRRHLHRELEAVKAERTQVGKRIKGLLAGQGVRMERVGTSWRAWIGCGCTRRLIC